ncbi:MAG: (Fe-S)-binding protein [Desulfovibrionaceae bacterium]
MADLHTLAKMLQELDDQMVACMKCGLCQAVCPVFAETMREGDVTRGKIALLENLAHEMLADAEGVQAKLNKCLLCGSCAANCPSGVKIMDIFLRARVIVNTYMGLSPAKKAILRGMLTRPRLFNGLLDLASKFQGLFVKPASEIIGSSCTRFTTPLGDRHFMPLAKAPLHATVKPMDTPAGKSGLKVAFYPGCLVDKIFPNIGHAVLKVLAHHGVGVFLPDGWACCGIPAISSGEKTAFDTLVKKNLDAFANSHFDYMVTACGTCTATIHEIWPMFSGGYPADLRDRVNTLAAKTMDINAFLVDILKVELPEAKGQGRKVTFHDSCHLKKSLGVAAQPRALVKAAPNTQLVEMAEADRCCGCGGSFNLYHYDLSKRIGGRKRDNIVASGAEIVATGCPACMLQISDMLSQAGQSISVRHPVELYAEGLR